MSEYQKCKMCGGKILLVSNRCHECGALDNIFTQFAAWRLHRKSKKNA